MLERLDRPGLVPLLLLGQLLLVAPHGLRLPLWLSALCLGAFAWRGLVHTRSVALPGRILTGLIALLSLAAVVYEFRTVAGREAGVALLATMSCMKLIELKARRDALLLIYLGYFLVGTNFLFSQTIPMALYLLGAIAVNTLSLVCLNRLDGFRPHGPALAVAGRLTLQTLPYMLVLFVLFPRLPGPLWRMPDEPGRGVSGMSDSMTPGDVNALALNDDIAFRVRFEGAIPPKSRLYWRGLVFDRYDGLTWNGSPPGGRPPEAVSARAEPLQYTVALEPGRYRWLYALDLPAQSTPNARLSSGYQLMLDRPLNDRHSYRMRSHEDYRFGVTLSPVERTRNLQLPPEDNNPQAQAWAQAQRAAADSDSAYLNRVLRHIHDQPFYYTLNPPILAEAQIDDFWFTQRRGFCEHYAGSLVYLMRAAGVPARVVVGYQGGEANPFGDYVIVRQSDAHAWTEVWLAGEGWRRVDPTAAIAPGRVEVQLNRRFSGIDPLFDTGLFEGAAGDAPAWWQQAGLYWDALNNSWNTWVVDYNQERQGDFLNLLGLPRLSMAELGHVLALLLAATVAVGSLLLLRERGRMDTIARTFQKLERRLARRGYRRAPDESPTAFLARVVTERPELASELEAIARLYTALRYRNSRKPLLLGRDLRSRVARLSLTRVPLSRTAHDRQPQP